MKILAIKFKNWEYWPFWTLYLSVFISWFFASIRLRSFLYFTTVNPRIETGGFVKESKFNILNQIPKEYIPTSLYFDKNATIHEIIYDVNENKLAMPLVVKPNVGERGFKVSVCHSVIDLERYLEDNQEDIIIQEFINYPIELAVLYHKYPNSTKGVITSVCKKEFLSVTGNGRDNVRSLMYANERALLQLNRFEKEKETILNTIPKKGETIIIENVGNHSKGTKFLDANDLIDEEFVAAFDKLSNAIPDFNYGRFDIKCNSIEELKRLEQFSILEINGVSSEPAHIYDPKHTFSNARKTLVEHWNILSDLAEFQINKGVKPMKVYDFIKYLRSA